jgi:ABC-2 type transport system ATP-binding protein
MAAVITLDHVTKTYGGERGVDDVSFEVVAGAVFGFLGPNGAGKTTTISMLVDLIRPTGGQINIFGLDSQKDGVEIRRRIGFLAGDFALDAKLTGRQQLTYFANLRGGVGAHRIKELAERLACNLDRPIKTLSRGNRQKVGLISALMHDPELLVLDEPTSGLDPLLQAEFNLIIHEYKQAGKTVFISSHALGEIQEICDEVAFIREGKLITATDMKSLTASLPKRLTIITADKKARPALQKLAGVRLLPATTAHINATFTGDINHLLNVLSKCKVKDLSIHEADLETVFLQYYTGKNDV